MPQLIEQIRAAQRGDEQAMEALIVHYSQPIRQECSKIGLTNQADLSHSDLMQEVFMQVWKKIQQFKGTVDGQEHVERAFELWLRKNARSALGDLVRRRQAQKRKPDDCLEIFDDEVQNNGRNRSQPSGPSSIFYKHEEAERIRMAMHDCLDEQARQIVLRHIVDGETFQQIAESTSLSYDQVRYAFHCAQAKLAQRLG